MSRHLHVLANHQVNVGDVCAILQRYGFHTSLIPNLWGLKDAKQVLYVKAAEGNKIHEDFKRAVSEVLHRCNVVVVQIKQVAQPAFVPQPAPQPQALEGPTTPDKTEQKQPKNAGEMVDKAVRILMEFRKEQEVLSILGVISTELRTKWQDVEAFIAKFQEVINQLMSIDDSIIPSETLMDALEWLNKSYDEVQKLAPKDKQEERAPSKTLTKTPSSSNNPMKYRLNQPKNQLQTRSCAMKIALERVPVAALLYHTARNLQELDSEEKSTISLGKKQTSRVSTSGKQRTMPKSNSLHPRYFKKAWENLQPLLNECTKTAVKEMQSCCADWSKSMSAAAKLSIELGRSPFEATQDEIANEFLLRCQNYNEGKAYGSLVRLGYNCFGRVLDSRSSDGKESNIEWIKVPLREMFEDVNAIPTITGLPDHVGVRITNPMVGFDLTNDERRLKQQKGRSKVENGEDGSHGTNISVADYVCAMTRCGLKDKTNIEMICGGKEDTTTTMTSTLRLLTLGLRLATASRSQDVVHLTTDCAKIITSSTTIHLMSIVLLAMRHPGEDILNCILSELRLDKDCRVSLKTLHCKCTEYTKGLGEMERHLSLKPADMSLLDPIVLLARRFVRQIDMMKGAVASHMFVSLDKGNNTWSRSNISTVDDKNEIFELEDGTKYSLAILGYTPRKSIAADMRRCGVHDKAGATFLGHSLMMHKTYYVFVENYQLHPKTKVQHIPPCGDVQKRKDCQSSGNAGCFIWKGVPICQNPFLELTDESKEANTRALERCFSNKSPLWEELQDIESQWQTFAAKFYNLKVQGDLQVITSKDNMFFPNGYTGTSQEIYQCMPPLLVDGIDLKPDDMMDKDDMYDQWASDSKKLRGTLPKDQDTPVLVRYWTQIVLGDLRYASEAGGAVEATASPPCHCEPLFGKQTKQMKKVEKIKRTIQEEDTCSDSDADYTLDPQPIRKSKKDSKKSPNQCRRSTRIRRKTAWSFVE
jgi:hypothetical protein